MDYTTRTAIEAQLERTLTSDEVVLLPLWQAGAKTYIDERLESSFDTSITTSTKYYDGGEETIDIDPCHDVVSVNQYDIYGNAIYTFQTYEYEFGPHDTTVKRWLRAKLIGDVFPPGKSNIGIVAVFNLGAVNGEAPADIKLIATRLICDLIIEGNDGKLKQESIEGYSRTFADIATKDQTIESILNYYNSDRGILM